MLSPKAVREADLVQRFWPAQGLPGARGDAPPRPAVGLQLAMAPAGAFRNFRLSPGGSSTWVHLVSGKKVRPLLKICDHLTLHAVLSQGHQALCCPSYGWIHERYYKH